MREHIRCFVKRCPLCLMMSAIKNPIDVLPLTNASYKPMYFIGMDTKGPLTPESNELQYILVIIDHFTRYIELYPLKDTSAQTSAQPLVEYIAWYGISAYIQSDKGSQFVNEVISEVKRTTTF